MCACVCVCVCVCALLSITHAIGGSIVPVCNPSHIFLHSTAAPHTYTNAHDRLLITGYYAEPPSYTIIGVIAGKGAETVLNGNQ